ncbi:hypothetical protein PR048_005061 [Dryococelus australis]|uniref:Uncharacterized protein n=1 Tax=Dryococelus australis TaxID=614101 RepID=A0ABQ9I765_9NEOP|nr:hypothetical protein PR048_005061 [Dryococelus australis]
MPVWFDIKKSKSFTDGPKNVFEVVESSRFLPENLIKVVDPVIVRNAFFRHPENLLLSPIVDERKLGLRRIMKARNKAPKVKSIRSFVTP